MSAPAALSRHTPAARRPAQRPARRSDRRDLAGRVAPPNAEAVRRPADPDAPSSVTSAGAAGAPLSTTIVRATDVAFSAASSATTLSWCAPSAIGPRIERDRRPWLIRARHHEREVADAHGGAALEPVHAQPRRPDPRVVARLDGDALDAAVDSRPPRDAPLGVASAGGDGSVICTRVLYSAVHTWCRVAPSRTGRCAMRISRPPRARPCRREHAGRAERSRRPAGRVRTSSGRQAETQLSSSAPSAVRMNGSHSPALNCPR